MTYLLDTCILSKLRKISIQPNEKLKKWIMKHNENSFFISVLTIGEIQLGISKLSLKKNDERKKRLILEDWFIIDGLIAATALTHNLTVVTENINDFLNTGVRVFNPWLDQF